MLENPVLSILIVAYNSREYIGDCLDSLNHEYVRKYCEVFLVDNANDGTISHVKSKYPRVKIVENNINLGFARGNNLLAEHAKGEYLLLLNPDTTITADFFNVLAQYLPCDHTIIGALTVNDEGSPEPTSLQFAPSPFIEIPCISFLKRRLLLNRIERGKPFERPVVSGAALIINRSHWLDINGFDSSFFMYSEEVDLCFRSIRKTNKRPLLIPSLKVIHHVGGSYNMKEARQRGILQGKSHFAKKHFNPFTRLVYLFILLSILTLKYLLSSLSRRSSASMYGNLLRSRNTWVNGYFE